MPRSTPIPIGVPTGLPGRLFERKTRLRPTQLGAAVAVEIWQWLIAKLPWGHPTRVLARVKGWPTRGWHLRAWLEPGGSQNVLVPTIVAPAKRRTAATEYLCRLRNRVSLASSMKSFHSEGKTDIQLNCATACGTIGRKPEAR